MQEYQIIDALMKKYDSHIYQLSNSFVFDWECDFFSKTREGYCQEIEIKISRSDFLKDFSKEKHKIFSGAFEKKEKIFVSRGLTDGDLICEFTHGVLSSPYFRAYWNKLNNRHHQYHYEYEDVLNGFKRFHLEERRERIYAPAVRIKLVELENKLFPNKFSYCVPTGLIKPEEIPAYAGLMYIDEHGKITDVKKPPFLHKRKLTLSGILLDKFYFKSIAQRKEIKILKRRIEILEQKNMDDGIITTDMG